MWPGVLSCDSWSRGLRVLPQLEGSRTPGAAPSRVPAVRVTIRGMRRTVVIVDDHARFRRSARALLELEGFHVIGEAADGEAALAAVDRLKPDVALVDVGLPDMTGFDVSERVSRETSVILVSSRNRADIGRRARSCGALGFLTKDELSGEALAGVLERRA